MPVGLKVGPIKSIGLVLGLLLFLSSCSSLVSQPGRQRLPQKELELERRWVRSTLQKPFMGPRPFHRMPPLLTDEWIIQSNGIDGLKIFDRKTASRVLEFPIRYGSEGGAEIGEGLLFFGGSDGKFRALDLESFEVKWDLDIKSEGLARPLYSGGGVYFLAGNGVFYALEASSGSVIWTYNRRDSSEYSIRGGAKPKAVGGHIYMGFSDGYFVSLNQRSGQLEWEVLLNKNKRFRDVDAEAVVEDGRIYVAGFDSSLFCLDQRTGEIIWSFDSGSHTGVLVSGDRVFLSSNSGQVFALDRGSGKKIWTKEVVGLPTAPVIMDGVLLVGSSRGPLLALSPRTGEELAQYHPGRGVVAGISVDPSSKEIFFLSVDANLFALRMQFKSSDRAWSWQKVRELL